MGMTTHLGENRQSIGRIGESEPTDIQRHSSLAQLDHELTSVRAGALEPFRVEIDLPQFQMLVDGRSRGPEKRRLLCCRAPAEAPLENSYQVVGVADHPDRDLVAYPLVEERNQLL